MAPLALDGAARGPLTVLCLGAHSDDIEIGCGGTILSLLAARRGVDVHWVVFASTPSREDEARRSAERFLRGARSTHVAVMRYGDSFFPYIGGEIKESFEDLKKIVSPDVVFTHYRDDRHQDHRVISDLTWNSFRNHLVLEYEIPKYDGDFGIPNCFVPFDEPTAERKIAYLMEAFQTQRDKRWFNERTFRAVMALRGIECAAPTGYAEAFYGRKLTLNFATKADV